MTNLLYYTNMTTLLLPYKQLPVQSKQYKH